MADDFQDKARDWRETFGGRERPASAHPRAISGAKLRKMRSVRSSAICVVRLCLVFALTGLLTGLFPHLLLLFPIFAFGAIAVFAHWVLAVEQEGLDAFLGQRSARLADTSGGAEYCVKMALSAFFALLVFMMAGMLVWIVRWDGPPEVLTVPGAFVYLSAWALTLYFGKKKGWRSALRGLGLRPLRRPKVPCEETVSANPRTEAFVEDVREVVTPWTVGFFVAGLLLLPFPTTDFGLRFLAAPFLGLAVGYSGVLLTCRRILGIKRISRHHRPRRGNMVPWWKYKPPPKRKAKPFDLVGGVAVIAIQALVVALQVVLYLVLFKRNEGGSYDEIIAVGIVLLPATAVLLLFVFQFASTVNELVERRAARKRAAEPLNTLGEK